MYLFDTDAIAPAERGDAVVTVMRDATLSTHVEHLPDESAAGGERRDAPYLRMRLWQLGPVDLVETACSAGRLWRTRRQAAQDTEAVIAIGVGVRGSGHQRQHGSELGLGAGRLYLTDLTAPYSHLNAGPTHARTLRFSAGSLALPARWWPARGRGTDGRLAWAACRPPNALMTTRTAPGCG